jgi:hypothetical protein
VATADTIYWMLRQRQFFGLPLLSFSTLANKTRKCYLSFAGVRTCRVTCRDAQGVEHTVQLTVQSLYEAVAQALRVFRENDWSDDLNRGASVSVMIRQPEVEHRVRIQDFQKWLDSAWRSPVEMALKSRLRTFLER